MTKVISPERLLQTIYDQKGTTNVERMVDESGFWRTINFQCLGNNYSVVWFKNGCSFNINGVKIKFHDLTAETTWPNKFKKNFHLTYNDDIVAIIPCEEYKDHTH